MTFDEAVDFFGSRKALEEILDVSRQRISQISIEGGFNYPTQCVLQVESKNKLKARRSDAPVSALKAA